ncbi:hypothetical protein [Azospirillum rugosum]|uniref:Transmembrane protein (Alph_Pro_TM) n=1 Tax=Azospirillum rugosum TaxID=416170 RepID=A0ABS4SKF3_9PROT|nr:hypothetical protein [Azospirillum rugosum]MBP2292432.1 hypothetical protein [Azospirillum rugosum]MDQ0526191.1 hypothetical protein [Azospirillum rugosum]
MSEEGNGPQSGNAVLSALKSLKFNLGIAVLAVLPSFLAASDASLKSLVSGWLDSCLIVVDVNVDQRNGREVYRVDLTANGKVPARINLGFEARDAILRDVSWERDLKQHNLLFHALSGSSCASNSDLCSADQIAALNRVRDNPPRGASQDEIGLASISVNIDNFNELFSYRFIGSPIGTMKKLNTEEFGSYVMYPDDVVKAGGLCRVHRADFFNTLVGSNNATKFIFLMFFVAGGSVLVGVFKRWGNA